MDATNTGRLTEGIDWRARRVLFDDDRTERAAELGLTTEVDLAHLVMLVRTGLVDRDTAATLAREITALRAGHFRELRDLPAPRGLYLMYEGHLRDRLGETVGGRLHTGRSRNDLKATTAALKLRGWLLRFLAEAVRLEALLLGRARAYRDVVMPVYTHFQAAMPLTYGHYLLGVAMALGRDIDAVRHAAGGLRQCPMGAGAVAGTDLPIAPEVTATLLGFEQGPLHSVDAVASRDVLLRVLAGVAGVGVTISRLATDLQVWSTAEFGLVEFPERLVGGSSAMPQKRNAFLLEHLKARASAAVGGWAAAAGMMVATPFTNTIEVGTEAVAAGWPGLLAVEGAVTLAQLVAADASPVPERMRERAEEGFTVATAVANTLVRAGVPFRTAHHVVGAAVRAALDRGATTLAGVPLPDTALAETAPDWAPDGATGAVPVVPDVGAAADAAAYGGGPGEFDRGFAAERDALRARAAWRRSWRDRLDRAADQLAAEAAELTAPRPSAPAVGRRAETVGAS